MALTRTGTLPAPRSNGQQAHPFRCGPTAEDSPAVGSCNRAHHVVLELLYVRADIIDAHHPHSLAFEPVRSAAGSSETSAATHGTGGRHLYPYRLFRSSDGRGMTGMRCPECHREWSEGNTFCPTHAVDLEPVPGEAPGQRQAADPASASQAAGSPDADPPAGMDVSCDDPDAGPPRAARTSGPADREREISQSAGTVRSCWSCGESVPDTGNTHCLACSLPLTAPRLVVKFPGGQVGLSRNEQTTLGRSPDFSPHAHTPGP
jgi:hypothetical protein